MQQKKHFYFIKLILFGHNLHRHVVVFYRKKNFFRSVGKKKSLIMKEVNLTLIVMNESGLNWL